MITKPIFIFPSRASPSRSMRSPATTTGTMRWKGLTQTSSSPKAARAAIEARVEADLGLTSTNARRIDKLMAEAARLRRQYGVDVGTQRAPFFELQTDDFALLAIDSGVLRTVDERQWAWLERALGRSRGKFIMAIVGHPRFRGGRDLAPTAEGAGCPEAAGNFPGVLPVLAEPQRQGCHGRGYP